MAKAKIMIIEDEWIIAEDIRSVLEEFDYEVTCSVASGEEALMNAEKDRPDLILIDIMLKGNMTGIEVAGEIHRRFNTPHIFVSAYVDEGMLEKAKITEPFGYLLKPFDDREIQAAIEMALYKHRLETLLKESEEKFRSLFNQASDSIFLLTPDNDDLIIVDLNDAAMQMHCYSREEMIGRSIGFLDDPDTRAHLPERKRILTSGELLHFEGTHRRKDGSVFPVEISARLIHIGGKPFVLAIDRDIAIRKKSDEERERLNRELEIRNREVEELLRITSHDLRSPLVNLRGFTNELVASLKTVEQRVMERKIPESAKNAIAPIFKNDIPEAIKYIKLSISKMDRLVHGLSQLSRTGRARLVISRIDMNSLLKEIQSSFDFQCKEKGAVIEIGDLPACFGDELLINQLFSNLIGNAIKYLDPDRPGMIKISGKTNGGYLVYCIEDNGIGIAKGLQEKIFEIFYQLNPVADGEGLGLAIVRKIVERHNGEIRLESEPGAGTSVFVRLPEKVDYYDSLQS